MRTKTRKLEIQGLEDRRLMAADLSSVGELRIETGNGNDNIEVSIERSLSRIATTKLGSFSFSTSSRFQFTTVVTEELVYRNLSDSGSLLEEARFDVDDVLSIRIYANSGHDEVTNNTGIRTYMYGGFGNDILVGGSGTDYLYGSYGNDILKGNAGNDRLYGGSGADELSGDSGADRLYGQSGSDTLRGGSGIDRLYGSSGHDNLYGQNGNDYLYGGSGDDGLFGGDGTDYLNGSTGDDRFLVVLDQPVMWWMDTADNISDLNSNDARINFTNGEQRRFNFSGDNWTEFGAGEFTNAEIELIDIALGDLHQKTGNTSLLKTNSLFNNQLTFERLGARIDGNFNAAGVNASGKIILVDPTFDGDGDGILNNSVSDEDWLMQVVHHEVAHNFDNENTRWNEWKEISGWRSSNFWFWEDSSDYTTSDDGDWAFLSDSVFARDYGKFNPYEDFATYFAKTMMEDTDRNYRGGSSVNAEKAQFMDEFFAELA